MKTHFSGRSLARTFGIALLLAGGLGCSSEPSTKARGKELYGYCLQCHQADGGGSQLAQAPNIAGLGSWYLEGQIVKFRDGVRGANPDDVQGLRMRPMARTLASTEDIKLVAEYIAGLPPVESKPTLAGADPERGRALFQTTCVSCHGDKGQGNEAMKAPGLAGRDDWYVASQLAKFRSGLRGANTQDTTGSQMRAMAMTLPDHQAVRDVAAYVSSLK